MFEIRELRHLLSIDEFRHFGRAAAAVGMSQPALTKSLQRIEQALASTTPTPNARACLSSDSIGFFEGGFAVGGK